MSDFKPAKQLGTAQVSGGNPDDRIPLHAEYPVFLLTCSAILASSVLVAPSRTFSPLTLRVQSNALHFMAQKFSLLVSVNDQTERTASHGKIALQQADPRTLLFSEALPRILRGPRSVTP